MIYIYIYIFMYMLKRVPSEHGEIDDIESCYCFLIGGKFLFCRFYEGVVNSYDPVKKRHQV